MRKLICLLVVLVFFCVIADAQFGTSRLTNNSGGTVTQYQIVVIDTTADSSFTTTNVSRNGQCIGIVASTSITNGSTGKIVLFGVHKIKITGAITRGDYVVTSTTVGSAASGGTTNPVGACALALDSGTGTDVWCNLGVPLGSVDDDPFIVASLKWGG
ncbi:unnamed protein product, partial [marine sediment metagenome]